MIDIKIEEISTLRELRRVLEQLGQLEVIGKVTVSIHQLRWEMYEEEE